MLKELFTWKGRTSRLRYFSYSLISILLMVLSMVPLMLEEIEYSNIRGGDPSAGSVLFMIAAIVSGCWIGIVTTIKRLHDLDLSAWWLLVTYLPFLFTNSPSPIIQAIAGLFSLGWAFYLLFASGTPGDNRFGPAQAKPVNVDRAASASSHA